MYRLIVTSENCSVTWIYLNQNLQLGSRLRAYVWKVKSKLGQFHVDWKCVFLDPVRLTSFESYQLSVKTFLFKINRPVYLIWSLNLTVGTSLVPHWNENNDAASLTNHRRWRVGINNISKTGMQRLKGQATRSNLIVLIDFKYFPAYIDQTVWKMYLALSI